MNYTFRAECITDCLKFRNACTPGDVTNFSMRLWDHLPDVTVNFDSELNLGQLRRLAAEIEDAHVIVQTLQPTELYTGERL